MSKNCEQRVESNDTELTRALLGLPSKSTVPTEHSIYLHLHRQSSTQDSTQDSKQDSTASSRVKKEAEGKSKTGEADPVYVSEWWRGQSLTDSDLVSFLSSRPEYTKDVLSGLTPQGILSPTSVYHAALLGCGPAILPDWWMGGYGEGVEDMFAPLLTPSTCMRPPPTSTSRLSSATSSTPPVSTTRRIQAPPPPPQRSSGPLNTAVGQRSTTAQLGKPNATTDANKPTKQNRSQNQLNPPPPSYEAQSCLARAAFLSSPPSTPIYTLYTKTLRSIGLGRGSSLNSGSTHVSLVTQAVHKGMDKGEVEGALDLMCTVAEEYSVCARGGMETDVTKGVKGCIIRIVEELRKVVEGGGGVGGEGDRGRIKGMWEGGRGGGRWGAVVRWCRWEGVKEMDLKRVVEGIGEGGKEKIIRKGWGEGITGCRKRGRELEEVCKEWRRRGGTSGVKRVVSGGTAGLISFRAVLRKGIEGKGEGWEVWERYNEEVEKGGRLEVAKAWGAGGGEWTVEQVTADPLVLLNVDGTVLGRRGLLLTLLDALGWFLRENEECLGDSKVAREALVARDVVVVRCLGGVVPDHEVVRRCSRRKGVAVTLLGQGWEGGIKWLEGIGEEGREEIAGTMAGGRVGERKKARLMLAGLMAGGKHATEVAMGCMIMFVSNGGEGLGDDGVYECVREGVREARGRGGTEERKICIRGLARVNQICRAQVGKGGGGKRELRMREVGGECMKALGRLGVKIN
ncbi:hypothetical protein TrCOL_g8298 [Triparma columacea]|uniref:Uncharacterized protein n=1 Tax=Triparma columacea TaxID=722753 RepID=A0A9W7GFF0_9STRA|nr:hypothetical protein TrCOL_g8298 [Triparma columacea]